MIPGTYIMRSPSMNFHCSAIRRTLLLLALVLVTTSGFAQKKGKYACVEANPAQLCNASNTCGSGGQPCEVDVKRTTQSASATPSIQKPKGNALFCVPVGTTVNWKSTAKETGFIVDVGPTSPFDPPGAIIGGSDKPVSVVAKREGCYKYSAGACKSGAIYGMCYNTTAELIVTK
jgi:hypothetical protein